MSKRKIVSQSIHARQFGDIRLRPGTEGYIDVTPMLDKAAPEERWRIPQDLLIMPTAKSSFEVPEELRELVKEGLVSPGTWLTHRCDSSKTRLGKRLKAHELSQRTVSHLLRAHGRAKRPSIVEVFCDGYLWPFVWFMGLELCPRDTWLEDLDEFANTGRVYSAKGDPVVTHERDADPSMLDESSTEIGRQALAFKRRTVWALWCGDCRHVFTLAKNFEPFTSTPVFDLKHAADFVDSYDVPGADGWLRQQDSIAYGSAEPHRVRWFLLHKRNRRVAKRLMKEHENVPQRSDGARIIDETLLACPACDSGHQEVAQRHSEYWLNHLQRDGNYMIFQQTAPRKVPIRDPELFMRRDDGKESE